MRVVNDELEESDLRRAMRSLRGVCVFLNSSREIGKIRRHNDVHII